MAQASRSATQHGQYARANGLKMYYEERGSGPPLILLHGGTATSSMWEPQIPFFIQHFRVITPDSRGHGKTNNPTGEFSYRLMADDVVGFIQGLGLTKPLICGYSDGGQIVLEIGMRYPGLAGGVGRRCRGGSVLRDLHQHTEGIRFRGPRRCEYRATQARGP